MRSYEHDRFPLGTSNHQGETYSHAKSPPLPGLGMVLGLQSPLEVVSLHRTVTRREQKAERVGGLRNWTSGNTGTSNAVRVECKAAVRSIVCTSPLLRQHSRTHESAHKSHWCLPIHAESPTLSQTSQKRRAIPLPPMRSRTITS
jgi:hypothetical protein